VRPLPREVRLSEAIVRVFANTVKITPKCSQALYDGQEYDCEVWVGPDEVAKDGRLQFAPRYGASIDWIDEKEHLVEILKKHKVSGDISFIHLFDGEREQMFDVPETKIVRIWGYRFDGKGNMKKTKGAIRWSAR